MGRTPGAGLTVNARSRFALQPLAEVTDERFTEVVPIGHTPLLEWMREVAVRDKGYINRFAAEVVVVIGDEHKPAVHIGCLGEAISATGILR